MFFARASTIALALVCISLILVGPVWGQPDEGVDTAVREALSSLDATEPISSILDDVVAGNVRSWKFGRWSAVCWLEALPRNTVHCAIQLSNSVLEIEASSDKWHATAPIFALRSYGNHRELIVATITIDDHDPIEFSGTYGMPDQVTQFEMQIQEGRQIEVRFLDRHGVKNSQSANLDSFREARDLIIAVVTAYTPEVDDLRILAVVAAQRAGEWWGYCATDVIKHINYCDVLGPENLQINVYQLNAAGKVAEPYIAPKMGAKGIRDFLLRVGDYTPFQGTSYVGGEFLVGRDAEMAILEMLRSDVIRYTYRDSDFNWHNRADYLIGFREVHAAVLKLSKEFENTDAAELTGSSDQSELNDVRLGEGGSFGSSADAATMPSLPTERVGSSRSLVIAAVIASILFMAGAFAVMIRAMFFASARNTGSTSLNSASKKSAM